MFGYFLFIEVALENGGFVYTGSSSASTSKKNAVDFRSKPNHFVPCGLGKS
jgi:hypothetical protein